MNLSERVFLMGCRNPFDVRLGLRRKNLQPKLVGGTRIMQSKISAQFNIKLFRTSNRPDFSAVNLF